MKKRYEGDMAGVSGDAEASAFFLSGDSSGYLDDFCSMVEEGCFTRFHGTVQGSLDLFALRTLPTLYFYNFENSLNCKAF